jgi:hypothetical protein
VIKTFPDRTQARIGGLEAYFSEQVLGDGHFHCRHYLECNASSNIFHEGQLPHVGKNYDLEIEGRPTRIVFVGQEYGSAHTLVDLAQRSSMIENSASAGFGGRNLHMKGTTSQLRLLLGRALGPDEDGERLVDAHIFDGFALVNYLLCSSLKAPRAIDAKGGGKGNSSAVMRANCGHHFFRTLEILEPTLVLVQGQGVRQWLAKSLNLPSRGPVAEQARIAGRLTEFLTFDHPSAGGKSGYWGNSTRSRYLTEIVEPQISLYRRSLQERAPPPVTFSP